MGHDLANPTEAHAMLREMVRDWVKEHLEPQAHEHDREERFNLDLMRELGELGLLGIEQFLVMLGFRRLEQCIRVISELATQCLEQSTSEHYRRRARLTLVKRGIAP